MEPFTVSVNALPGAVVDVGLVLVSEGGDAAPTVTPMVLRSEGLLEPYIVIVEELGTLGKQGPHWN